MRSCSPCFVFVVVALTALLFIRLFFLGTVLVVLVLAVHNNRFLTCLVLRCCSCCSCLAGFSSTSSFVHIYTKYVLKKKSAVKSRISSNFSFLQAVCHTTNTGDIMSSFNRAYYVRVLYDLMRDRYPSLMGLRVGVRTCQDDSYCCSCFFLCRCSCHLCCFFPPVLIVLVISCFCYSYFRLRCPFDKKSGSKRPRRPEGEYFVSLSLGLNCSLSFSV